MKTRCSYIYAFFAATLIAPQAAHADITGSIDSTITLETACIINGDDIGDGTGSVDFGSLNFGSHSTLFTQADAEVLGTATPIAVQCTPGTAPVLHFDVGENDGEGAGGGLRAMAHETEANQYVTYNLYSNAGRTTVIPIGGTITLEDDGSAQTVNVYARAFGAAGLIAGQYDDVITVLLEL